MTTQVATGGGGGGSFDKFIGNIREILSPLFSDFYHRTMVGAKNQHDLREIIKEIKKSVISNDFSKLLHVEQDVCDKGLVSLHELFIIHAHTIPWKKSDLDQIVNQIVRLFVNYCDSKISTYIAEEWAIVKPGLIYSDTVIRVSEILDQTSFNLVSGMSIDKLNLYCKMGNFKIDQFTEISRQDRHGEGTTNNNGSSSGPAMLYKIKIDVSDKKTIEILNQGVLSIGPTKIIVEKNLDSVKKIKIGPIPNIKEESHTIKESIKSILELYEVRISNAEIHGDNVIVQIQNDSSTNHSIDRNVIPEKINLFDKVLTCTVIPLSRTYFLYNSTKIDNEPELWNKVVPSSLSNTTMVGSVQSQLTTNNKEASSGELIAASNERSNLKTSDDKKKKIYSVFEHSYGIILEDVKLFWWGYSISVNGSYDKNLNGMEPIIGGTKHFLTDHSNYRVFLQDVPLHLQSEKMIEKHIISHTSTKPTFILVPSNQSDAVILHMNSLDHLQLLTLKPLPTSLAISADSPTIKPTLSTSLQSSTNERIITPKPPPSPPPPPITTELIPKHIYESNTTKRLDSVKLSVNSAPFVPTMGGYSTTQLKPAAITPAITTTTQCVTLTTTSMATMSSFMPTTTTPTETYTTLGDNQEAFINSTNISNNSTFHDPQKGITPVGSTACMGPVVITYNPNRNEPTNCENADGIFPYNLDNTISVQNHSDVTFGDMATTLGRILKVRVGRIEKDEHLPGFVKIPLPGPVHVRASIDLVHLTIKHVDLEIRKYKGSKPYTIPSIAFLKTFYEEEIRKIESDHSKIEGMEDLRSETLLMCSKDERKCILARLAIEKLIKKMVYLCFQLGQAKSALNVDVLAQLAVPFFAKKIDAINKEYNDTKGYKIKMLFVHVNGFKIFVIGEHNNHVNEGFQYLSQLRITFCQATRDLVIGSGNSDFLTRKLEMNNVFTSFDRSNETVTLFAITNRELDLGLERLETFSKIETKSIDISSNYAFCQWIFEECVPNACSQEFLDITHNYGILSFHGSKKHIDSEMAKLQNYLQQFFLIAVNINTDSDCSSHFVEQFGERYFNREIANDKINFRFGRNEKQIKNQLVLSGEELLLHGSDLTQILPVGKFLDWIKGSTASSSNADTDSIKSGSPVVYLFSKNKDTLKNVNPEKLRIKKTIWTTKSTIFGIDKEIKCMILSNFFDA